MRARRLGVALTFALTAALQACVADDQAPAAKEAGPIVKGGDDRYGDYEFVSNWWKPAPNHDADWGWGSMSDAKPESADRVLAVHWGDRNKAGEERPGNFLVVANRNGEIVENWSQWDSLFQLPHSIFIDPKDPEKHIWIVERGKMQVLKFTNDGKQLVLRVGDKPVPKDINEARANPKPGPYNFGQPASMTFLADGGFLLADGYWNSRVVRFDKDGKYVSEFGTLGEGPGQFNTVHSVATDAEGRIYTADRSNHRVQVFTPEGQFIEEWPNILSPAALYIDGNQDVWVLDRTLNRVLKYNKQGQLLYHWGAYGGTGGLVQPVAQWEGGMARPHGFGVDQEGNVYIANFDGSSVSKFTPKAGADPSHLIKPVSAAN